MAKVRRVAFATAGQRGKIWWNTSCNNEAFHVTNESCSRGSHQKRNLRISALSMLTLMCVLFFRHLLGKKHRNVYAYHKQFAMHNLIRQKIFHFRKKG